MTHLNIVSLSLSVYLLYFKAKSQFFLIHSYCCLSLQRVWHFGGSRVVLHPLRGSRYYPGRGMSSRGYRSDTCPLVWTHTAVRHLQLKRAKTWSYSKKPRDYNDQCELYNLTTQNTLAHRYTNTHNQLMNVNCWTFNLLTMAKMFTNFKWRDGVLLWTGWVFLWFLCVCVCMCQYALGPLSQCTFLIKTQLALSAKVIKWSFTIT